MTTKKEKSPTESLVIVRTNHAYTTSRKVAEVFGKEHRNVVRDIHEIFGKCSSKFNMLNFERVKYKDKKGEIRYEFRLTRDGFSMLAMGYTGEKAIAFKEAYINAFNVMAEKLANKSIHALPVERGAFKGLVAVTIGGHRYFPYRDVLRGYGISTGSGTVSRRIKNNPEMFTKFLGRQLVREDFVGELNKNHVFNLISK